MLSNIPVIIIRYIIIDEKQDSFTLYSDVVFTLDLEIKCKQIISFFTDQHRSELKQICVQMNTQFGKKY